MIKIKVVFAETGDSDVYEVSRVPCVGEKVYNVVAEGEDYIVEEVIHYMNADPETQVMARILVR